MTADALDLVHAAYSPVIAFAEAVDEDAGWRPTGLPDRPAASSLAAVAHVLDGLLGTPRDWTGPMPATRASAPAGRH